MPSASPPPRRRDTGGRRPERSPASITGRRDDGAVGGPDRGGVVARRKANAERRAVSALSATMVAPVSTRTRWRGRRPVASAMKWPLGSA